MRSIFRKHTSGELTVILCIRARILENLSYSIHKTNFSFENMGLDLWLGKKVEKSLIKPTEDPWYNFITWFHNVSTIDPLHFVYKILNVVCFKILCYLVTNSRLKLFSHFCLHLESPENTSHKPSTKRENVSRSTSLESQQVGGEFAEFLKKLEKKAALDTSKQVWNNLI